MTSSEQESSPTGSHRRIKPRLFDVISCLLILGAIAEIAYLTARIQKMGSLIKTLQSNQDVYEGQKMLPWRFSDQPISEEPLTHEHLILYLSPRCKSCTMNSLAWRAVIDVVGPENVVILAPGNSESTRRELADYLLQQHFKPVRSFGISGEEVKSSGLRNLPRTILVNRRGYIAQVWRGVVSPEQVLVAWRELKEGVS